MGADAVWCGYYDEDGQVCRCMRGCGHTVEGGYLSV